MCWESIKTKKNSKIGGNGNLVPFEWEQRIFIRYRNSQNHNKHALNARIRL